MECGAFQGELGTAIAQLESLKRQLLEIFDWGGQPGMISDQERQSHVMALILVRTSLPVIDIHLRHTMEQLSGTVPPDYITFQPLPVDEVKQ